VRSTDNGDQQLVADGLVGAAPLDWPKDSTWLLQRASQSAIRQMNG
jgi:hypothetical protein